MNFRQGEPTPEEMLSDPIVRVRYGGGRDRPARTRGHSETDRPDAGPASASRGTAVHAGLTRRPARCMRT